MRSIKFRAWDNANGKMLNQKYLDCHVAGFRLLSTYADDYSFMQYTGVKDSNGIEIYEGDVVRRSERFEGELVVKFLAGAFRAHQSAGDARFDDFIDLGKGEWKIVGNIYENPQLLKRAS